MRFERVTYDAKKETVRLVYRDTDERDAARWRFFRDQAISHAQERDGAIVMASTLMAVFPAALGLPTQIELAAAIDEQIDLAIAVALRSSQRIDPSLS